MQWPAPLQRPCVAAPNHKAGLYFSKTSQRPCRLGRCAFAARPCATPRAGGGQPQAGGGGCQGSSSCGGFGAHGWEWRLQRVNEIVGVNDLEGLYEFCNIFDSSSRAPASFLAWLVLLVPGFDLNEELRPPLWSRCFQIHDLRIVENLMRETPRPVRFLKAAT